jgi:hypothetical protein
MNRQSIRIQSLLLFVAIATSPTYVLADGWTWGPFSKAESSRDASPLYSTKSSSASKSWMPTMKMPTMPWSSKKTGPRVSSYSRSNSSTWTKMSKTSKRWWSKTAEMLDPYPDPKPSTYASHSETKKPKTSMFNWFQPKESTEPRTANEFLRQEPLR